MEMLWRVERVAQMLDLTIVEVEQLLEQGQLEGVLVLEQWRVKPSSVYRLVGKRRVPRRLIVALMSVFSLGVIVPVMAFDVGVNPVRRTTGGLPRVLPVSGQYHWQGKPFDGNVLMSFELHGSPDGDRPMWSSSGRAVAVKDGHFSVTLGDTNDITPLPWGIIGAGSLYLQILVNDEPLSPRQRLAPTLQSIFAAHAFEASEANSAKPGGALAQQIENNAIPVGTVVAFAGEQVPRGWFLCDGSARRLQEFPLLGVTLFNHRQARSSWGDGSQGDCLGKNGLPTTNCDFNLPDLRGMFLRGANDGRADEYADPDAQSRMASMPGGVTGDAVGSMQLDALGPHQHTLSAWPSQNAMQNQPGQNAGYGAGTMPSTLSTEGDLVQGRQGSQTRPVNVTVRYIIKHDVL